MGCFFVLCGFEGFDCRLLVGILGKKFSQGFICFVTESSFFLFSAFVVVMVRHVIRSVLMDFMGFIVRC